MTLRLESNQSSARFYKYGKFLDLTMVPPIVKLDCGGKNAHTACIGGKNVKLLIYFLISNVRQYGFKTTTKMHL